MAGGSAQSPAVVATRLWESIEQYARIGAVPGGGVTRPIFSPAEQEARRRLMADGAALGLPVRLDAAANVYCTRPGVDPALPAILIGSHLDSVPNGGTYDGPLGVLCALEVLRTLHEHAVPLRHPLTLVSLTGEEATAFGTSTFGSRALAGRLPEVAANVLPDGRTVRQALHDSGGAWDGLSRARAELGPVACFLEVHIEQGRRLQDAGQALAVVSGVCGIYRHTVVFGGEPGHAGTTLMGERHDALRAASRFVLALAELPAAVAAADPAATATVGFLEVSPNSPNVIPGEVMVVTDLRSSDPALLAALAHGGREAAHAAATAESVRVDVGTMLDQAPIHFDAGVRAAMAEAARRVGGDGRELSSQAGHDAVHLQSLAAAGMLFVRCADGVSHRPEESVMPEDAALAAQALLETVLVLDAN